MRGGMHANAGDFLVTLDESEEQDDENFRTN